MDKNVHIKRNNTSMLKKKAELEKLSYPIGKFSFDHQKPTTEQITKQIETLKNFPQRLKNLVETFSPEMLEKSYRLDGWTARQVIHHIADSHTNAYLRIKLALTEENPTIKPYMENLWAEQIDYQKTPIAMSLSMIEILHFRMVLLFENMKTEDFERTYFHPQHQKNFSLYFLLAMYVWHSEHHFAHLEIIKGYFL